MAGIMPLIAVSIVLLGIGPLRPDPEFQVTPALGAAADVWLVLSPRVWQHGAA